MVFKSKLTLALIAVIVALLGFFLYSGAYMNVLSDKSALESSVESLYELANPGVDAEVVTLDEESGLYKAGVKLTSQDGQVSYAESWITKDGKILTQNIILVKESVAQMSNLREFVTCLAERDVRIFGTLNQTLSPSGAQATLLQLNLLGAYSPAIYVSCDADIQACLDAGITQVPATYSNGTISLGLKNIEQLEEISGCNFE